ncbi:MAG: PLP-dependent aminotransferase family protein, partial [Deltaproteobacteria bacterium]|nr:PLP-dependent aminotransferase family protein [Deltaproteobacteria bacterium]
GRLVARRASDEALLVDAVDVRGYAPLRTALAEHLRVVRGVACTADDLVIVASVQQALDLVVRVTLDPGQQVWLEDPGYGGARAVFATHGARIVRVPVDADGLRVDLGVARAPHARLAYVTPGHQAPLGATMAIARRTQLLAWARAERAVIVEDDYDSEYRYEGRPVPALQGLDRAGVVVHLGTFSKTLLPSLRLAYAVVPRGLMAPVLAALSVTARYTPPLLQAALADLIAEGHFARHLRRMRELYAGRRAALLHALEAQLGYAIEVVGASAGLDLAVRLPRAQRDTEVVRRLAAHRIEATALSTLGDANGLELGFAPYSEARLRAGVAILREVLAAMPRATGTAGRAARARAGR